MGPAQAVDDVAVVGPEPHRLLDHAERALEVAPLLHPGIAEVVEHHRLVGTELQRLEEVGLGAVPLVGALQHHAARVVERPVALARVLDALERGVVGVDRLGKALLVTQQVAERDQRVAAPGLLGGHVAQARDGDVGLAVAVEQLGRAQARRPRQRRGAVHPVVAGDGVGIAPGAFEDVAAQQQRRVEIGPQRERHLGQHHRDLGHVFLRQQRRHVDQRLGHALRWRWTPAAARACRRRAGRARSPSRSSSGWCCSASL